MVSNKLFGDGAPTVMPMLEEEDGQKDEFTLYRKSVLEAPPNGVLSCLHGNP